MHRNTTKGEQVSDNGAKKEGIRGWREYLHAGLQTASGVLSDPDSNDLDVERVRKR